MDKIEKLLSRGVDQIIPSKQELKKVLESGKKLKVYQGFDASNPHLHIGHLVGLRKLRQFQQAGHEVIFLIGDFTGMIGDPSGKDKTRPQLTKADVEKNAQTYKDQASKVLDFEGANPVKLLKNSRWLSKITLEEFLRLASQVTYGQVIERDMFQMRIKNGEDIAFSELLYPMLQGYDSVEMDVDVEVGGSDQLFNMLMGRHLMRKINNKKKIVLTTPLLTDASGSKMGKTTGNAVLITSPPLEIFGQIMNFPDDAIVKSFEYLTDVSMKEIAQIESAIKKGKNPMQFKKKLAFAIVEQLNSEQAAKSAAEEFEHLFQKGGISNSLPQIKVKSKSIELVDFLVDNNLAPSKSEAKRLIKEGAVEIGGQVIEEPEIELANNQVMRVGKKRFVRITLE